MKPLESGKDMRKVVCLTTEEQANGTQRDDSAEVHIVVTIEVNPTTGEGVIRVTDRLGVGELTDDGKLLGRSTETSTFH